MSAYLKPLLSLASPSFYSAQFAAIIKSTHTAMVSGAINPLFKGMLLVGLTGYTMEYTQVGRYHVMDKQKIIKKALENHHH